MPRSFRERVGREPPCRSDEGALAVNESLVWVGPRDCHAPQVRRSQRALLLSAHRPSQSCRRSAAGGGLTPKMTGDLVEMPERASLLPTDYQPEVGPLAGDQIAGIAIRGAGCNLRSVPTEGTA